MSDEADNAKEDGVEDLAGEAAEDNAAPNPGPAPGPAPGPTRGKADVAGELASLKDQLLRALAEVENTRRRGERTAQEARSYAIDRFAKDLLPIADSLQKAIEVIPPDEREAAGSLHTLVEGVELTMKLMTETFARHGLKRIGAKGDVFDSNLHQAVAQIPSDAPAGSVAEVFQYGYTLADRTLRPAMVAVSAGGGQAPAPDRPPEGKIDIKV
jgi:molecular chaperone GrpE